MNFGEKLKQIRTERAQTQPQFAAALGIEQSYLSKLENDKSLPSADMFNTIVAGLGIDAAAMLRDIDQELLDTTLSHIPAVGQFNTRTVVVQEHNFKRWLYGSALAWIVGFALMLAANDGIFFSNRIYKYSSPGVILAGEPQNIFETQEEILSLRRQAKLMTDEQFTLARAEFKSKRVSPVSVETPENRGSFFTEKDGQGVRRYVLIQSERAQSTGNRILQFLGAIIFTCGFVGVITEWRLRRLKTNANNPLKHKKGE